MNNFLTESVFAGVMVKGEYQNIVFAMEKFLSKGTRKYSTGKALGADKILSKTRPGGAHKIIISIWPGDEFSCVAANLVDGWSSLACVLGHSLQCHSMSVVVPKKTDAFGLCSFTYRINGDSFRSVTINFDDKWKFFQDGTPIAGEDLDAYKRRKITDRMNGDDVVRISQCNGFDLNQLDASKGCSFIQE